MKKNIPMKNMLTYSHYQCSPTNHTFMNYRFEDVLKNGVVLCRLMNKIQPNSIKRIKESGTAFQLMENIQAYVLNGSNDE